MLFLLRDNNERTKNEKNEKRSSKNSTSLSPSLSVINFRSRFPFFSFTHKYIDKERNEERKIQSPIHATDEIEQNLTKREESKQEERKKKELSTFFP